MALVIAIAGVVGAASLATNWVFVAGIDEDNATQGMETWLIRWPVMSGLFLLAMGLVAWLIDRVVSARLLQGVAGVLILLPSVVVIAVTEVVQATLPTWIAPVLTNSDVFAFRAGVGAWMALVVGIGLATVSLVGLSASDGPQRRRSDVSGLALTMTVVSASALMVLRARPFAVVDLEVDTARAIDSLSGLAEGAQADQVLRAVGEAGRSGDGVTINLVAGDIPGFGLLTLLATITLIVGLVLMVVRPSLLALIGTAAASGALIFSTWSLSAVLQLVDSVIPKSWLSVDGYVAVEARASGSLWWLLAWGTAVTIGIAACSMGLTPTSDSAADPVESEPIVSIDSWGPAQ